MLCYKKRGKIAISTLVSLILFAIAIVAIFGFLIQTQSMLPEDILFNYGCYLGNAVRSGGGLFTWFSGGCILQEIENANQERLASLLRTTWWMYGQGKWDFGSILDELYPSYVFTVDETIYLQDFVVYLASNSKGKEVPFKDSDYNYLQKGSLGQTICFETDTFADSIPRFEIDESYYIIFRDTQAGLGIAGKYDDIIIADELYLSGAGSISCLGIEIPVVE